MKSILSYSLLAAAMAAGVATAQPTTATTAPVGYSTSTLNQGFNALGLTLQTPAVAAGNFEGVAGATATDDQLAFTPLANRIYILEITSGTTQKGVIAEVGSAGISGTTITAADNLQSLGVAAGDSYKLRVAPTLEEIFTTVALGAPGGGGVLNAGLNSTGADVVWVPTGAGGYNKYFLHTSGQFRIAGTTTASPNVPLVYSDGFFVEKKGAAPASLTVSGEVKTVGTNSSVSQGFNLISAVAPVGLNLSNAGVESGLTAGLNPTGADIIWVQQPNLSYNKYFRTTSGFWRSVAAPTTNMTPSEVEAVALSNGFFIEKKGAAAGSLKLGVPAGYSNL